jgi:hypothetical protein
MTLPRGQEGGIIFIVPHQCGTLESGIMNAAFFCLFVSHAKASQYLGFVPFSDALHDGSRSSFSGTHDPVTDRYLSPRGLVTRLQDVSK